MNARKALLAVTFGLTAGLTSCGSLNRAGKDAFVGIVYGGATDGYGSARDVRAGLDSGSAVEVLAFPFTFLYHGIEHALYCGIHVLDLPLCPFYALTEIPADSPGVQPLDFYQGTWFDNNGASTDATSGESLPPRFGK